MNTRTAATLPFTAMPEAAEAGRGHLPHGLAETEAQSQAGGHLPGLRPWLPWGVLAAASLASLLALAVLASRHLAATERLRLAEARVGAIALPPDSDRPGDGYGDEALPAAGGPPHRAPAGSPWFADGPAGLLAHIEDVASASAVSLRQFQPATGTVSGPSRPGVASQTGAGVDAVSVSLQLAGDLPAIGHALQALFGSGPVLELVALRLAGGLAGEGVSCVVVVRSHDPETLRSAGMGGDLSAARRDEAVIALPWAVHLADRFAGAAPPPPRGPLAADPGKSPASTPSDPLPGMRLVGVIHHAGQGFALLQVPGRGQLLLGAGDTIPGTAFRLLATGEASATFTNPAGRARVLRMGHATGSVAAAREDA